ncbi:MAG TPA: hypothetical protein VF749_16820 [Candidatus Acidoferrum sp.]
MPKKRKKVKRAKRLSLKKEKVSAGAPKVLKRDREITKRKIAREIAREREVKREIPKKENEPE